MNKTWIRLYLPLVFLLLTAEGLQAQSPSSSGDSVIWDGQLWVDYNPSFYLKPHMRISTQLGYRYFPDQWHRVYARMNFRWTPKKLYERMLLYRVFEFHGGFSFFYTNNIQIENTIELRPYQGFMASFPTLRRFRLIHYVRVEERFQTNSDQGYYDFSGRMRYRVAINQNLGSGPVLINFYLPASLELFFNMDQGLHFNDVFRGTLGVGAYLGDEWKAEFLLSYHNVNNSQNGQWKSHDLVFRIRLFTNLEFKPTYSVRDPDSGLAQ